MELAFGLTASDGLHRARDKAAPSRTGALDLHALPPDTTTPQIPFSWILSKSGGCNKSRPN